MIHDSAVIAPGARLGRNVSVGPFAVIEDDVDIGDDCVIGPHVCVLRYTTLGAGCRVHAGAVLGDLPQDLSFAGEPSDVRIGARCWVREGVTVHRGAKSGSVTQVGDDCLLMANSHVAHNVRMGSHVILANGVLLAGHVEVGDRAFISGNAAIHQFVRIGRLAMVGGVGAVTKDVPPFCTTRTGAYNRIGGMNMVGLRRAGVSAEERLQIQRAFKIFYRGGLNAKQAVQAMRAMPRSPLVNEFVDFVEQSKRGVCAMRVAAEDSAG
jgi:UDP-N-acetylglucosamine acyltransferase